ncbi:hypothetical protein ONS95_010925 [Cadophora gregata]|uniref:uncharacterized protein n=1 Tax=Cadophora gregata TaxID=51156 RepID=UPI0026DD9EAE|nr:uncharacterized protein ONS95_010925 [Cadophora gregata]KAK0119478.1 hypothetical protein ONS95_010925 [Cadophora gregata]
MKGLASFALLFSVVTAAAVGNKSFPCPEKTWGGCCTEVDEDGGGHTCHDAATVESANLYICSNKFEHSKCCHFAPWVVHDAHPLICA